MANLNLLLEQFNIKPQRFDDYQLAFTHSSVNNDANTVHHDYERLEFMGDAVIGFVVAELTYRHHPQMSPGLMTKTRSKLIQSKNLALLARKYHLDKYIHLGQSLSAGQQPISDRILEDVFEAFFGAVYLDQGLAFTTKLLETIFTEPVQTIDFETLTDFKSQLQEAMQAAEQKAVEYILVKTEGPAHDRLFTVEVRFNELVLGRGSGKTKQQAEQQAAKEALLKKAG